MADVAGKGTTQIPEDLEDLKTVFDGILRDILQRGIKQGLFREVNVEMMVMAYDGLIMDLLGYGVRHADEGALADIEPFVTRASNGAQLLQRSAK